MRVLIDVAISSDRATTAAVVSSSVVRGARSYSGMMFGAPSLVPTQLTT